jgi:hypothetical protein
MIGDELRNRSQAIAGRARIKQRLFAGFDFEAWLRQLL